ncbi:MAG: T9SS type A sorting domain-containing protein, partial [Bacteroidetes bacterium]
NLSIFDVSGKIWKSAVMPIGQPLELSGLAAGVYWVKAVTGKRVYTGKFIKN